MNTSLSNTSQPEHQAKLRCLRMEFFYRPEFLGLRESQKLKARLEQPGACDLVVYSCLAVKETNQPGSSGNIIADIEPFEPPQVTIRRLRDLNIFLKTSAEGVFKESIAWRALLAEKDQVMAQKDTALALLVQQSEMLEADLTTKQTALNRAEQTSAIHIAELGRQMVLAGVLAHDVDVYRSRKSNRLLERVFDRADIAHQLPPALAALLDDSLIFMPSLHGFLLQASINLQRVQYIAYRFRINKAGLCGLKLAPVLDIGAQNGVLGVELVSPANQIVAQVIISANKIGRDLPVSFSFSALPETSAGRFELRIFARDLDVPLRVLEWRKYPPLGIGPLRRLPFCGFDFAVV
jgi:hypothetical protein